MSVVIDLNSDLGEGAGNDAAIMPFVTSANIACGAHAGDDQTMRETIALAVRHGVAVGAHPGYRDKPNFGRVALDIAPEELLADLRSQVGALADAAKDAGVSLAHVKAHGALYNRGERDDAIARIIVRSTGAWPGVALYAPPGSAMERAAIGAGVRVAREGFVDRAYEPDGTLRPRRLPGAVIDDPAAAAAQALAFVRDGGVRATDGSFLPLEVDTLCLHGDAPAAPRVARAVRDALDAAGVAVRALAR
ncbi:MAG: 5-oxoprolinase subunit PxpA [Candidatus Limnocylindria bacterium]